MGMVYDFLKNLKLCNKCVKQQHLLFFGTIQGLLRRYNSKIMLNNVHNPESVTLRLTEVSGFEGRKNDIVYGKPFKPDQSQARVVVFFPGDVQDYVENMEAHRDNKHHKEWSLEGTAAKLRDKFPGDHILVVKASRMDYKTFNCFQNFVRSDRLGVPNHTANYDSLKHLDCLLMNVSTKLQSLIGAESSNLAALDLEIVGFSKGCVVLNQFLYEFHNFKVNETDESVSGIIHRIKDMYWLDGGHAGGKNTWISDKDVLKILCTSGIHVHVHVTPYQIEDDRRPWIKKEERIFSDFLTKHGCPIERKVHFESAPPSIFSHFQVIDAFK